MASSTISRETFPGQGKRVTQQVYVIDADELKGVWHTQFMYLIVARSWCTVHTGCSSIYLASGFQDGLYDLAAIHKGTNGPSMTRVWDTNAYPTGRVQITFLNADGGYYFILPIF